MTGRLYLDHPDVVDESWTLTDPTRQAALDRRLSAADAAMRREDNERWTRHAEFEAMATALTPEERAFLTLPESRQNLATPNASGETAGTGLLPGQGEQERR